MEKKAMDWKWILGALALLVLLTLETGCGAKQDTPASTGGTTVFPNVQP